MNAAHPSEPEILRWVEREDPPAPSVGTHLSECPSCEELARRLASAAAFVRESVAPQVAPPARTFTPPRPRARISRISIPAAAAAVLLAAVGLYRIRPGPAVARLEGDPAATVIREGGATRAERAPLRIRWADGTFVVLDRGSAVARAARRGFLLESGRVHVATAGGPGFSVSTPGGRIVDLGTVFQVDLRASPGTATVLRGRVRVEPRGGPTALVSGGESAALGGGAGPRPADVAGATEWVQAISFPVALENEPLERVFQALEEIGPYRIEAPARVREFRVTASIEGKSLEAILRAVSEVSGVPHRVEAGTATFAPSR